MAFDNSTIITFNSRNLITIAVMVTIGWFILHVAVLTVNGFGGFLGNLGLSGTVDAGQSSAGISGDVDY